MFDVMYTWAILKQNLLFGVYSGWNPTQFYKDYSEPL